MGFDEDAKLWDTEERITRARQIADEIRVILKGKSLEHAMEFGAGTGLISFNLRDLFAKIVLVDSSEGMIDILKQKITASGTKNMEPCLLDITRDENLTGSYDVIYNSMVMHHIDDVDSVFAEFYKLLNNEGKLVIVDLDKEDGSFHKEHEGFTGHNGFEQQDLINKLSNKGFKNIEIYTFYKGKKMVDSKEVDYSLFILKAEK